MKELITKWKEYNDYTDKENNGRMKEHLSEFNNHYKAKQKAYEEYDNLPWYKKLITWSPYPSTTIESEEERIMIGYFHNKKMSILQNKPTTEGFMDYLIKFKD